MVLFFYLLNSVLVTKLTIFRIYSDGNDSNVDNDDGNGDDNSDDKGDWSGVAFWQILLLAASLVCKRVVTFGILPSFLNFFLPCTDENLGSISKVW